jgi:hypothetical protein
MQATKFKPPGVAGNGLPVAIVFVGWKLVAAFKLVLSTRHIWFKSAAVRRTYLYIILVGLGIERDCGGWLAGRAFEHFRHTERKDPTKFSSQSKKSLTVQVSNV